MKSRGNHDCLGHAGHVGAVDREQHPWPWQRDTGVGGESKRIRISVGRGCEGNTSLVGIDRMRCAGQSDDAPFGDSSIGGSREGTADLNGCGTHAVDYRASGEITTGIKIWWGEYLAIEVVGGTGAAKATSTAENRRVGHEESG